MVIFLIYYFTIIIIHGRIGIVNICHSTFGTDQQREILFMKPSKEILAKYPKAGKGNLPNLTAYHNSIGIPH